MEALYLRMKRLPGKVEGRQERDSDVVGWEKSTLATAQRRK